MASGARHKKGGSGSKSCCMPADTMTAAEIKQLNGNVMIYRLGKPMDWETFAAMPADLQAEYIEKLIDRYGVTNTRLAGMFGIDKDTLGHKLEELKLRNPNHHMTAEQEAAWHNFEVIV
jgi:DNA-binding NtrC family response regulator